ncbi:MAG: hypothetical protein ACKVU4_03610 [Phycisphaerales bacterium]
MPLTAIHLRDGLFEQVRGHLLPHGGECEEAAFLFARAETRLDTIILSVSDSMMIPPEGFASRSRYYLELTDETRAAVIKRAHDLGTGLIECHSHPSQRGACFSWSDLHGFDDFVPHVRWRLGGRPYAAVVFATDSIDALAWAGAAGEASPVSIVNAGKGLIHPTGATYQNWNAIYEGQPL